MIRTITHGQFQDDYNQGYSTMKDYIHLYGFVQARSMFNLEFPINSKPSMKEYYFNDGRFQALCDYM